jgi:subtilisin family serine protease
MPIREARQSKSNSNGLRTPGPGIAYVSMPLIHRLAQLWAEAKGDSRVLIAVLEGPVDLTHPALIGSDLTALEVVVPFVPRHDGQATRHGALAASLIFGRHESRSPVAGMAPGCRGILVPVFSDSQPGAELNFERNRPFQPVCSQLDFSRAILVAAEHGARIVNISGGQYAPTGAVNQCVRRGILIFAATGNDGRDCLHIPAALPGVLAVGAMDARGEPLKTSNWGQSFRAAGLLAPGAGLVGARPEERHRS